MEVLKIGIADNIFIENCKNILQNGTWDNSSVVRPSWQDGRPAHTISLFGIINRYNLQKEFPILTLRRTYLKNCIEELFWIWQQKSSDTTKLNCNIWDAWAKNGNIGCAYGEQLSIKHKYPEGEFDQVDRVLFDLKNNPSSRRIITNIYNHADLHKMNLYPCAYGLQLSVKDGKLSGILNQRSQDFLVANNWNVCQYAILLHIFAQVAGLTAHELIHVIGDAHIYDRHIDIVKELITKKPYEAPKLKINMAKNDFYSFNIDDFELINYKYHEFKYKIPVAV